MHSRVLHPITWLLVVIVGVTFGLVLSGRAVAVAPSGAAVANDATVSGVEGRRFERWATITRTSLGYYYDAGQQHTRLVVTEVAGGLRYADRRTDVLRSKPDSCDRKPAQVGLVVVCRIPNDVSARNPMRVKVFTRLGNDSVDTSALRAGFRLYGLADAGDDTFIGGDGNDFVNGAFGIDHVQGGAGNDLLRGGENHDVVRGGPGKDKLSGLDGPDRLYGGPGDDRVGGHEGDDRLYAGPGTDFMLCWTGFDRVYAQRADRIMADCERTIYR
jgi:Ca2+-binding RTX toxin-like protein